MRIAISDWDICPSRWISWSNNFSFRSRMSVLRKGSVFITGCLRSILHKLWDVKD